MYVACTNIFHSLLISFISNLQFSQDDSHKVMISSEDSKIRIFDGVDIVRKFKGKVLYILPSAVLCYN